MYKKILLFCFLILLVGCKKVEDNGDYVSLVNDCLQDKAITNSVSLGYKYYIPRGVKLIKDYDYNQVFLVDNNYIYLYVDIISYFYHKDFQVVKGNAGYYREFDYKNNQGYIRVLDKGNKYFVSIGYYYSRIEAYVNEKDLNKIITLSSIILNSIDYNDAVIEKVVNRNLGELSEFTYELDKPDDASSNFSHYLEEYVQKEEKKEQLPEE